MKRVWCGLLVLLSLPTQAVILTTNKLETILEHCDKGTLVVFDVDDTLVADASRNTRLVDKKVPVLHRIEHTSRKPCLMEENIPLLLQQIARKGANIVALTSRSPEHLSATIQQLEHVGIRLAEHCPVGGHYSDDEEGVSYAYNAGVICCGLSDKGDVLDQFLSFLAADTSHYINKLVFVDNQLKNVTTVYNMFEPRPGTIVTSVLYTKASQNRLSTEGYEVFCKFLTEFLRVQGDSILCRAFNAGLKELASNEGLQEFLRVRGH